jgi:hypothetical protein
MMMTRNGLSSEARELLMRIRQWPLGSELSSRVDAQLARVSQAQG